MFLMSPFARSLAVSKLICWHRDWGVFLFWKDLMNAACILAHTHAHTSQSLGVTFNISLGAHILKVHTSSVLAARESDISCFLLTGCSLVALIRIDVDAIVFYYLFFHLHLSFSLSFYCTIRSVCVGVLDRSKQVGYSTGSCFFLFLVLLSN